MHLMRWDVWLHIKLYPCLIDAKDAWCSVGESAKLLAIQPKFVI